MANELSREQLHRLARLGADTRLAELEEERRAILRAFPGVTAQASRLPAKRGAAAVLEAAEAPVSPGSKKRLRRRKPMSADQRKAASERMRKFWAERRKIAEA